MLPTANRMEPKEKVLDNRAVGRHSVFQKEICSNFRYKYTSD